jgi:hypothetical protein
VKLTRRASCEQCVVKIARSEYISFAQSAIGNTLLVWAFLGTLSLSLSLARVHLDGR